MIRRWAGDQFRTRIPLDVGKQRHGFVFGTGVDAAGMDHATMGHDMAAMPGMSGMAGMAPQPGMGPPKPRGSDAMGGMSGMTMSMRDPQNAPGVTKGLIRLFAARHAV